MTSLAKTQALPRRALLAGAAGALALLAWPRAARAEALTVQRVPQPKLAAVPLLNMQGQPTHLLRELDVDEPLWLNFVFTTCSTTCSMQTAMLVALQSGLLRDGQRARFLSLTIDPDNDTPTQLAQFAARFGVQRDWQFCTGRYDDLLIPQRAFDVYRGSKAAHPPVLLLRPRRGADWWRISGFPTVAELRRIFTDTLRAR